jgi:hypothetical protein
MSGRISRPGPSPAIALAASTLLATVALAGCQQLFTTSLAAPLARDEVTLPKTLTAAQAADLAAQAKAESDPKLAAAVVGKLVDQVTDPATQPELAAAAASAAITASGASDALLSAVGEAMGGGDLEDLDAVGLLADIQAGITPDLLEALNYLADIGDPTALTGTDLSATDYLLAAVVIAASAIPADADPTDSDVQDAFKLKPEYGIAVAIIGMVTDYSLVESGSQAEDLLNQFSSMFGV